MNSGVSIGQAMDAFWHRIRVFNSVIVSHQVRFFLVTKLRLFVSSVVVCAWAGGVSTVLAFCILNIWKTVREDHIVFLIFLMNRVGSHLWNLLSLVYTALLEFGCSASWVSLDLKVWRVAIDYNRWVFVLWWRLVEIWAILGILRIGSWPRVRIRLWLVTMRLEIIVFETGFLLILTTKLRHSSAELGLFESGSDWWRRSILVRLELVDVMHAKSLKWALR